MRNFLMNTTGLWPILWLYRHHMIQLHLAQQEARP